MKRSFTVTLNVMAYSLQDAEAKVDLLVQMGAFVKDFNVSSLAASLIKSFIVSKVSKLTEKKKLELSKGKKQHTSLTDIAFGCFKSKS